MAKGDQLYKINQEEDGTPRPSNIVGRPNRMRGGIRGEILQTPERALSHNTPDVPPQAPQRQNASPTEFDQDDVRVYTSTCTGVFKATIEASQIENKSDVLKGFGHVAGNVIRWLGSYVS